jgi:hypothetical protein
MYNNRSIYKYFTLLSLLTIIIINNNTDIS